MARRSKTEQERAYMRSFWDECRTLQADYTASVSLFAYPTDRPGVWRWRLVFTPLVEDQQNPLGSQSVQFEYPTAQEQALAGALWVQAMGLSRMVSEVAEGLETRAKRKR